MTDKEAYDKLEQERPVIIRIMEQKAIQFNDAEALANWSIAPHDTDEWRQLITQAARAVMAAGDGE